MKKVLLISVFLVTLVACSYGQTYYYKAVAVIDKDGIRSKPNIKGIYLTFSNNMNICYTSDANGYKGAYSTSYHFRKTQNGTHVYEFYITSFGNMGGWKGVFYYFSSDFEKLIHCHPEEYSYGVFMPYWSHEYIRTNGPQDDYDDNIPTF